MFGTELEVRKANEVCERVGVSEEVKCGRRRKCARGKKCARGRKCVEISKGVSFRVRKRVKGRKCCRFGGSKRLESSVSEEELLQ